MLSLYTLLSLSTLSAPRPYDVTHSPVAQNPPKGVEPRRRCLRPAHRIGRGGLDSGPLHGENPARHPDQDGALPSFFTHFQPHHAQLFFPNNEDPSDKATSEILAEVDGRYEVLSNGERVSDETFSRNGQLWKRSHWKQSLPHSSYLVAHEWAHKFFGNFVTCRTRADTWLNEGFATWLSKVTETASSRNEYVPLRRAVGTLVDHFRNEELQSRVLKLLDDVKTPSAKEALEAISRDSPSERLRAYARECLLRNFSPEGREAAVGE